MVAQVNSPAAKILEVAEDPRLSREVKAFLELLNSGGVALETLPPLEARQVLVDAQASVEVDFSGIEESEKTITADGYPITLNIVRPEGVKGTLPVFIFIHGGGWVLGDYPTHKRMVRDLVVLSGFAAVFVNYTRTPDAQYPQAINEIYAATKWVAEHGEEIGVDGKNLAVVGNSVGGNMTAVTALKAKANGGPHIKLQIMMWPIVDADFETNSYHQFGDKRYLTVPE
jgi:acetyl esterase/lipase